MSGLLNIHFMLYVNLRLSDPNSLFPSDFLNKFCTHILSDFKNTVHYLNIFQINMFNKVLAEEAV
jgi:hypothetical protein